VTLGHSKTWVDFTNGAAVTFEIRDGQASWPDAAPVVEVKYQGPAPEPETDTVQLSILKMNEGVFLRDFRVGHSVAPQIFFYGLPDATNAAIAAGVAAGFIAFVGAHRTRIEERAVLPSYGGDDAA
jgi:hypothetical protein